MAPGYWMNETSGQLRPSIERYLTGAELSWRDLALIRAYLWQWIDSPVWDQNPGGPGGGDELKNLRASAARLTDRASIDRWLAVATDFGLDPL
jgi:hypothetical protein